MGGGRGAGDPECVPYNADPGGGDPGVLTCRLSDKRLTPQLTGARYEALLYSVLFEILPLKSTLAFTNKVSGI